MWSVSETVVSGRKGTGGRTATVPKGLESFCIPHGACDDDMEFGS